MNREPTGQMLASVCRHGLKTGGVIMVVLALTAGAIAFAAENVTYEMEKVAPYEFRGDVRELPKASLAAAAQKRPYVRPVRRPPRVEKIAPLVPSPNAPNMNVPLNAPLVPMPAPSQNFAGLNFSDSCGGGQCGAGWPPDPNGDVGPNHYIQAVNDAYAIYNKTGTLLASFTEDSLWSVVSNTIPCNGNSYGDPVVLYDQLADRWILTNFAFAVDSNGNPVAPFYECIAVSMTSDPVAGGWWFYPLRMDPGGTGKPPAGTLNDYPKFGIWPDCLYMSANGFSNNGTSFTGTGTEYASLSRSDLESGVALTWSLGFINNTTDPFTMIPSNLLGSAAGSLPPAGTPNYFVSESQSAFAFEVREFKAGANCGAGGTLSGPVNVNHSSYTSIPVNTNVVPQPNTTNKLDMIDDRLMQKVQYRKSGTAESLWVVHNVISGGQVAPQWAQIDVTGGTVAITPVQQQIYAPDMILYRWMGSLAVDNAGNMALGYSTSNGTAPNFPSIAYSGRFATDPSNALPQTELQMVPGAGSQTLKTGTPLTFVSRWGDYTAMSVDPADDCTFWYTNQYYSSQLNGLIGNWQTRIGSFGFCPPSSFSVPTVTTTAITGINSTSATGGGSVMATGGTAVTDRGVCWNTLGNPTFGVDTCTSDGAGFGIFTSSITGLTPATVYHVRGYATNSVGTAYGGALMFTTKIVRPNPPANLMVQ